MPGIERIAVFTEEPFYSVRKTIVTIDRALPGLRWMVLVHQPRHPFPVLVRRQWRNLKRHGWRRVPAVARAVRSRLMARTALDDVEGGPGFEYSMRALAAMPNVEIRTVSDIHGVDAVEALTRFAPDLGLSLAAPILKRSAFGIPRLGTLNIHMGQLPTYRGMPPGFWELWNGESEVGCTVHWVDDKLDTGPVAAATTLEIEHFATVRGLQLRLDERSVELLRDVVLKVDAGFTAADAAPQRPGGKTYRQPTLTQVRELERRLAAKLPNSRGRAEQIIKNSIRQSAFTVGTLGLHRVAEPRVTVLLYHRVTDSARDNLTTGIEQFDRQLQLLRRHFRLVSLPDVIEKDQPPRSDKPLACVTFDDGYLDNYTNAVPLLLRNQVPATFFVSTGLLGTARQFPHDVRRGNDFIPLMTWDQLREMRALGFTVGSHTVDHVDCAAVEDTEYRRQLTESRDAIARELGLNRIIFSYPYGGRQHMTPERLEQIKEVGYMGCVSAYGGTNVGTVDRFNVMRRGVHWEYSDVAFLDRALGLW